MKTYSILIALILTLSVATQATAGGSKVQSGKDKWLDICSYC